MIQLSARQLQQVAEDLRGPTGQWLTSYLEEQGLSIRQDACLMIPETLGQQNERERNLGSSYTLLELVSKIPQTVNTQLEAAMQKENSK